MTRIKRIEMNGTYQVYVWTIENYQSNFRNMDNKLEGMTVATAIGWGKDKVNDGQRSSVSGSNGWSSDNNLYANHTESITMAMGSSKTVNKVDLYPRNNVGKVGVGFPIDFTIQTSTDGITWTTSVTQIGYAQPGDAVQSFTFPAAQTARYVKVEGTNLRLISTESNTYRMQFAEMEIY